jgi:hypothetical protein
MDDLRSRLANRVQLTTDCHRAYLEAVEEAFGADIDYGMLVKLYGAESSGQGHERKSSIALQNASAPARIGSLATPTRNISARRIPSGTT